MVKSKNLVNDMSNLFRSFYNLNTFSKKNISLSLKGSILYTIILLILISILNLVKAKFSPSLTLGNQSIFEVLFYSFIGIFIILLILSSLMLIFIKSFDSTKISFIEGIFFISSISLNFIFLANILDLLMRIFYYGALNNLLLTFLFILFIYYFINLIINSSKYFKINKYKIISSFILSYVTILLVLILNYLSFMVSSILN